jgi:hypothetical protein
MSEDPGEARRLRLFVAAHVAAPVVLYGLAVVVGGGLASVPFPPDLPHTRVALAHPQSAPTAVAVQPVTPSAAPVLPRAPDIEAPWVAEMPVRTLARND